MARKREEIRAGLVATPDSPDSPDIPPDFRREPPQDFSAALKNAGDSGRFPVVAEMKRRSPSAGLLRSGAYDPAAVAAQYDDAGAAALSVLTDRDFFGGDNAHLNEARAACNLPVLRKDFIADPLQVSEARNIGADAVLLIVAALPDDSVLQECAKRARELGMGVLAEVHCESELNRALAISGAMIGINNRNLRTFEVSLRTTVDLAPKAKAAGRFVISESGIGSPDDVRTLRDSGADAFLVGTAFMRADNPGDALRKLFAPVYSNSAIQP